MEVKLSVSSERPKERSRDSYRELRFTVLNKNSEFEADHLMPTTQLNTPQSSTDSVLSPKSPSDGEIRRGSKRVLSACLFWGLCLTLTAAGHRLYKAVVTADRQMSSETYREDGASAVWVGRGTLEDAHSRVAARKALRPDGQLYALPTSPFWLAMIGTFTLLAGVMAWSGQYVTNDGIGSLVGLFAGHFLWLGAVEFGLDAVGRRLGLCGAMEVVNGRIVGTHGSGVLIQMSVVFLAPVLFGLTMHESNRCAMFQWFRKRLPLTRSVAVSGRVENYAARTTTQYFLTVWFCYVAVLWLADPLWGHVGGILLLVVMGAIFIGTPYMIWRTAQQTGLGQSLRYSVSGAVVTWTGIEIAASMQLFEEPWLSTSIASGLVSLGLAVLLTARAAVFLAKRPTGPVMSRPLAGLMVTATIFGLSGCGGSNEKTVASSPEEIVASLQQFNERITAPNAVANEGMLRALASDDPEMAAQAAVAFGKARRVSATVRQQLEKMASSDQSLLSQVAALQALSRLGLLTTETQGVLDILSADDKWRQFFARATK